MFVQYRAKTYKDKYSNIKEIKAYIVIFILIPGNGSGFHTKADIRINSDLINFLFPDSREDSGVNLLKHLGNVSFPGFLFKDFSKGLVKGNSLSFPVSQNKRDGQVIYHIILQPALLHPGCHDLPLCLLAHVFRMNYRKNHENDGSSYKQSTLQRKPVQDPDANGYTDGSRNDRQPQRLIQSYGSSFFTFHIFLSLFKN